jgi:Uma2 family endonuclease
MAPGEASLLACNPWVARRLLTVAEYHRMGEVGILTERDRVELIEGELIAKSAVGSQHSGTVNWLSRRLVRAVGDSGVVAVQNPVQLDDLTKPEPDFAVLKPRSDDYRLATPRTDEVRLIIDVADSSLANDCTVTRSLYAWHGIPEFSLVNLLAGEVESAGRQAAMTTPRCRVSDAGVAEPELLPGATIPVAALLG